MSTAKEKVGCLELTPGSDHRHGMVAHKTVRVRTMPFTPLTSKVSVEFGTERRLWNGCCIKDRMNWQRAAWLTGRA